MEKIWLKNYPSGVPHVIDPDEYESIPDMLESAFSKYPRNPAFTNMGHTLSYEDINEQSRSFSKYLTSVLGLQKGDRVGIMLPNILQYPIVLLGILRSGLVAVNFNPLYTASEVHHQLVDSEAKLMVVLANFAHVATEAKTGTALQTMVVTELADLLPAPKRWLINLVVRRLKHLVPLWPVPNSKTFRNAIQIGRKAAYKEPEVQKIEGRDLAFLQYTGGTTGVAKGAELSHRNIVANVLQAAAWMGQTLIPGKEKIITALPLYHIFSLTANCLTTSYLGGENILITNPRDLPTFISELKRHPFTEITGVNTLFNALLNQPGFQKVDFQHLKISLGGGMAVQQVVSERWNQLTGKHIIEAYGLTETSPAVTINPTDGKEFTGSIGLPLPSTEIAVVGDDGEELGVNQVGELAVRGPQVTSGYWNRPEETARAFTKSGHFLTGDLVRVDERGFVYLVDRKKDMVLVSGFNVYPNEVEDVVAQLDDVLEVAAIGVPDPKSTEAIKLFIVRRTPDLTKEIVYDHCRKYLTAYKVPKYIEFTEQLPKSNVGKILRRKLRESSSTTESNSS